MKNNGEKFESYGFLTSFQKKFLLIKLELFIRVVLHQEQEKQK